MLLNPYMSFPVLASGYRYWRIYVTGYNYATWQIHETEFRSSVGGSDLTSPSTSVTALNYTTSYEPYKIVDNSFSTAWRPTTSTSVWIYVDLETQQDIKQVGISCGQFASFKDFHIDGSNDASNWTTVKTFSNVTTGWDSSTLSLFSLT